MIRSWRRRHRAGFLLLESMIAVFMFAVGLISLARSVQNLIQAEKFRAEDNRARTVLSNYLTMIENGSIPLGEDMSEKLEGAYEGMEIRGQKKPLELKNEKEQELFGLYEVKLEVRWKSGGEEIIRDMTFIIYPREKK